MAVSDPDRTRDKDAPATVQNTGARNAGAPAISSRGLDLSHAPVRHVPRRFFLGALLSGGVVAGLVGLGWIGAIDAPERADFRFSRGITFAPGERDRLIAHINAAAAEPRVQFRITGHTGTKGGAEANRALSTSRAETALAVFAEVGIPRTRIAHVGGIGGADPAPRRADEGDREYERRLSRVTIDAFVAP